MGQRVKRHELRHIQQLRQSDVNVNAAKSKEKNTKTFEFAVRSSQRAVRLPLRVRVQGVAS